MESLPLVVKSNIIPNLDVTSLIREIFQTEFESNVPSKKLSENLRKSLEYEKIKENLEDQETFRSVPFLENLANEKGRLLDYAENILEAYGKHEEALNKITKVELNIMETQAIYLRREKMIQENSFLQDLLRLKRHPLMTSYNPEYVKEYKLLQGESGLPPKHEAKADFRMKDFHRWKKRLTSPSQDGLAWRYMEKPCPQEEPKRMLGKEMKTRLKRPRKTKLKEEKMRCEVFRTYPNEIFFTDYSPGDVLETHVTVQNVHTKPVKFTLKPLPPHSPFKVELFGTETSRILPGLGFKLLVTFRPKRLDDENEAVILEIEDGSRVIIPLASYLEPPVLKTHKDLDEFTNNPAEKNHSSYIDCGPCFPGDSRVTKIRFHSFGGSGEFFLMSQENWDNWHISNLTIDNFTEIPPFRFYPSYFRLEKNQVFDLYVEFKPLTSGLHSDNIVIACNNGEARNLDVLADGVSWNRSFLSFEDSLEKDFPLNVEHDRRALHYLDLGQSLSTGRREKVFTVTNHSKMPFEFRWEMRHPVFFFESQNLPKNLTCAEVKIEPSNGIFEPYTSRTFLVSVIFNKKSIGEYRTVLSMYVIGLPYECIEQGSTIIRPSLLRGHFRSGTALAEEDNLLVSPEFSRQDTFENVQEGMKTIPDMKYQQPFPITVCRKHPSICAIPLKKTNSYSNIGGEYRGWADCTCSVVPTPETVEPVKSSECDYSQRKPDITDLGSDLLWDFVDVLVGEIEIWSEVVPADVQIEPCVLYLYDEIKINEEPMTYQVYVHNCNNFPVRCKWVKFPDKVKLTRPASEKGMSTLFVKGASRSEESQQRSSSCEENGDWDRFSETWSMDATDDYQVTCFATQSHKPATMDTSYNKRCDIRIQPGGSFTVPPDARVECIVSIASIGPGYINKVLFLGIEDEDIQMKLHVVGKILDPVFTVTPTILDFGLRKRGTRQTKHFKIRNDGGEPLEWKVDQYNFRFDEGVLEGPIQQEMQSNLKCVEGVIEERSCTIESYKLDGKKPGLQARLLKFQLKNAVFSKTQSRYVLAVANVQTPELAIEAPRFNNAILAPSKTMYVGQSFTQSIILRNLNNIGTTFVWGRPFGCHAGKLKLKMNPKSTAIEGSKNMIVEVNITPLEEGIVEHCYVPCFFSRKALPVILCIIGIIKNLRVTFEVTKESIQPCGWDGESQTVLKISWPIRNFDPSLGMSHIPESKILDFFCHCDEIELSKTVKTEPDESEEPEIENEDVGEELNFEEEEKEDEKKKPCMMKYYTPQTMAKLKEAVLEKKGFQPDAEDAAEYKENEIEKERNSESEDSAVIEYPRRECIDLLYYAASEIQFFNVLHKTVAVKHFLIRNESPLSTNFSLRVKFFAKADLNHSQSRIGDIKKRVFGRDKGDFEDGLAHGQPLLIATSPSQGTLNGWESVRVSVFVYGNTWGEYRDYIICDIFGLPPFLMKVFVQLSGHPILFPMFRTSLLDIPVLRFNTIKYKTNPVKRNIRVRNTSSIPLTVTWMVFLTSPMPDDNDDEPFSLCLDLYTDKESEDQEKATKSSRNYLSKNTSGSLPILDMTVPIQGFGSEATPTTFDSTRPEIQLLENFGKMDLHVFQIYPRELDLEPYSEEKITISFDPNHFDHGFSVQNFEAVVTGCVRLRQEFAHCPNIYQRVCGKDYVSKLLFLSASVERPLLQFEFFRNDLKYILNANDVLRTKVWRMTKRYLLRNRCQTEITTLVKFQPGQLFFVRKIVTFRKTYEKFNQRNDVVIIEPGTSVEVHVEAEVNRDQVMGLHKKAKHMNTKKRRWAEGRSSSSILLLEGEVGSGYSGEFTRDDTESHTATESYQTPYTCDESERFGFSLKPLDSIIVAGRKTKTWTDGNVIDEDSTLTVRRGEYEPSKELFGESLEIEELTKQEIDPTKFIYVHKEDLIFEQVGLSKQVISPELHVIFPMLKVKPELLDFGNVYIGETSRRYAAIINLTQFPTEMRVTTSEENEFSVIPKTAKLPPVNYKADVGLELKVEFTPQEPGFFKSSFKLYGNGELEFDCSTLTVVGFGTWDEKYKYPKMEAPLKLPAINSSRK